MEMRLFLIIFYLFIMSFAKMYSQDYIAYRQFYYLKLVDIKNGISHRTDECKHISEYNIIGNKLFVIASSSFQGKTLCENDNFTKLFYTNLDLNDTLIQKYTEISIKSPFKLYTSPNQENLLIKTLNNEFILLNISKLSLTPLPQFANCEIIGWWSSNEILYKTDNKLIIQSIFNNDSKTLLEMEELKYFVVDQYSKYYEKIDSNRFILKMYENKLDNGFSLYYYGNNKFKKIYSAQGFILDFAVVDSDNLIIIDNTIITDRGDVSYLTKINLNYTGIERIDLNDLLKINSIRTIIRLCENVFENKIIINVDGFIDKEKSGFYEYSIKEKKGIIPLLKCPSGMIQDIKKIVFPSHQ